MSKRNLAYLYLLITFSAWGSLYVVTKFVLGKIPAFTVLELRFFFALIILYIFLIKSKPKKIERQDYKYLLAIGLLGGFLTNLGVTLGVKYSTASISSLINAMNPITIMIFSAIFLKEKITPRKVICVILAIIGVYVILGAGEGKEAVIGVMFSILAVVSWSLASIVMRMIAKKYSAIQITACYITIAFVFTMPMVFSEIKATPDIRFDLAAVLALIYMGAVCSALTNFLWNKSLSMLEASTCSMFYPLMPMVSALLGRIFLNEQINANFIIGAVLIIGGISFYLFSKEASGKEVSGNESTKNEAASQNSKLADKTDPSV